MSDTFGTPPRTGRAGTDPAAAEAVHEAYSFACMSCGFGWEQSYEIAHHTDEHGHVGVVYYAGARRVPSPLTRPSCANCGGHAVRIMRSGRVASARWDRPGGEDGARSAAGALLSPAAAAPAPGRAHRGTASVPPPHHHWLSDLLALLHLRAHEGAAHRDRAA